MYIYIYEWRGKKHCRGIFDFGRPCHDLRHLGAHHRNFPSHNLLCIGFPFGRLRLFLVARLDISAGTSRHQGVEPQLAHVRSHRRLPEMSSSTWAHEWLNDIFVYLHAMIYIVIYIIFIYNYIYISCICIYICENIYIYIYLVQARCNTWRVWVESKVPVALMPTLRSSWSSSSHSKLSQMRTSSWSCSSGAKGNTWGILGTHGKK